LAYVTYTAALAAFERISVHTRYSDLTSPVIDSPTGIGCYTPRGGVHQ